jgi:hypothetical protein
MPLLTTSVDAAPLPDLGVKSGIGAWPSSDLPSCELPLTVLLLMALLQAPEVPRDRRSSALNPWDSCIAGADKFQRL